HYSGCYQPGVILGASLNTNACWKNSSPQKRGDEDYRREKQRCLRIASPAIIDALAPADGRGEASGATAGEPGGGDSDGRDEGVRSRPRCDRHHGAAEGGDVPDRRQATQPGARAAGASVGSSSRTNCGSCASARASSTSWRSPPEIIVYGRAARWGMPNCSSTRAATTRSCVDGRLNSVPWAVRPISTTLATGEAKLRRG